MQVISYALTKTALEKRLYRRFGLYGNGADMTDQLQTAIDAGDSLVYVPPGEYLVSAKLDLPSNLVLRGAGKGTHLTMTSTLDSPWMLELSAVGGTVIRDIRFTPINTGSSRCAITMLSATDCHVQNVWVDATDSTGIYIVDSDECGVDRLRFDGGAAYNGYGAHMSGCRGCRFTNSSAYRPNFGFLIVGSPIDPRATRAADAAFGNIIANCNVRSMSGHAFDVNCSTGNTISNCTARDYTGAGVNPAFQFKDPSGDDTKLNVFSGCTAMNVPSGFDMQQGSNSVFQGCTALNCTKNGFILNDSNNSRYSNCIAKDYGEYGIWLNSSTQRNSFTGIYLETATATATGIGLVSAGCNNNHFDDIQIVGTHAFAIDIAASSNNNRFGRNVNVNGNTVRDSSGTAIWPMVVATPVVDLTVGGATGVGAMMLRGMHVVASRASVVETITGTAQVQMGRVGSNSEICAAQNLTGAAGSSTLLTQSTQLLSTGAIVQGRVSSVATAGKAIFQYEGLPRL